MKVAVCTDISIFNNNKIFNKKYALNFPGTLWLFYLKIYLKKRGVEVITGDIALSKIKQNECQPQEVYVIQELDAKDGQKLISKGSRPIVLTGFESPLYANNFYDKLPKIGPKFKNRLLYSGAFKTFKTKTGKNQRIFFPSYDKEVIPKTKNWQDRKFMVIVIANKYNLDYFQIPLFKNPTVYFYWIVKKFQNSISRTRREALKNELQTLRLEAIEYFGEKGLLDLYGRGWENLNTLPKFWQKRLQNIIKKLKPKPIDDKIKTVSNYKFSITFENVSYPGHITEKMIDCFVAGVIPVYLGDPEITKIIPKNTFIDFRDYKTLSELHNFLSSVTPRQAQTYIKNATKFLNSQTGQKFSYQNVAENIKEMIESEFKSANI